MSDLFRDEAPPGKHSRKVFFYLVFGILAFSGFNAAMETFENGPSNRISELPPHVTVNAQATRRPASTPLNVPLAPKPVETLSRVQTLGQREDD